MSNKLTDNKIIRIIFVCHGNICRSPMAEYIMKEYVRKSGLSDSFSISSAAVSYEEQGNPIYPPAAAKLREKGIPYGRHSAHRITPAEARGADILVVMDHSNERLLKRIIDPDDFGKIRFMMDYAGRPGQDVADPWYSGDFERTYRDLDAACRGLVEEYAQLNII